MTDSVPSKEWGDPAQVRFTRGFVEAVKRSGAEMCPLHVDFLLWLLDRAAPEPAADVLSQIDELLQTMIVSAEVFTDADGTVTGYKIKTGALHKIVGLRTHLFFPQNMKEAERAAQPPGDG